VSKEIFLVEDNPTWYVDDAYEPGWYIVDENEYMDGPYKTEQEAREILENSRV